MHTLFANSYEVAVGLAKGLLREANNSDELYFPKEAKTMMCRGLLLFVIMRVFPRRKSILPEDCSVLDFIVPHGADIDSDELKTSGRLILTVPGGPRLFGESIGSCYERLLIEQLRFPPGLMRTVSESNGLMLDLTSASILLKQKNSLPNFIRRLKGAQTAAKT